MTNPVAPNFNEPLARAVLAQITNHPETHNQLMWATQYLDGKGNVCGTAFCFAGWACVIGDSVRMNEIDFLELPGSHYTNHAANYVSHGTVAFSRNFEKRAKKLLGLDDEQADNLFACSNDLDDLENIVGYLSGPNLHQELDDYTNKLVAIEPVVINIPQQVNATD